MSNKSKESALLADLKQRLADKCEQQRLMALEEALTLGQEGFDLFTQQSLQDQSEQIRQSAYWILHQHNPYLCKNSQEANSSKQIFPTDTIACVAISPDNQILVGGSWQKIWVWNLQTGELLRSIDGHSHWVLSVAISPDGNTLVSGSADKNVKFWNFKTGLLIRQINAHSNWVSAVAITPDGKTLVTASADKTIKIWDFDTNKLQHTLLKHSGSILSLAISPDGKVIASGSTDNTIKLWNLQTGELYRSLEKHLDWVQAVSLSKDSKLLISGSRDGDIKIWRADSDNENDSNSSNLNNTGLISQIIGFITLLVISKFTAGAVFWIGMPLLGLGNLFGKRNNQKLTGNISNVEYHDSIHKDFFDSVNKIIISHDSKTIISVSDDNTIKQWDAQTKQLVRNWIGHTGFVNSGDISSDGKILATASNDWIKLWNLHTGELLHPLKGCSEPKLSSLSILPSQLQMECGQSQSFSIKGLDQDNREISVEKLFWQAEGGDIDQNGLFIAGEKEGKFTVTATTGMFHISASVNIIEPPKLSQLVITPQKTKLECGKAQTFKVRGFDQRGSEIAVEKVLWQATGGTIDPDGTFYAGKNSGEFTVTANVEPVKTSALVTLIELPKLQELIISPLQPTLEFGQSLHFTVQGVDQYGNEVKIKNIRWQTTEGKIYPDGTFVAVDKDADITVTASLGNIIGTASFKIIEPSRLTQLMISPQQIVMSPETFQHFKLIGLDQRGNAIAISGINWKATGGSIEQNGDYFTGSNQKGQFSITATVGKLSVSAIVSVPSVLKRLDIFPPQIQLEPEATQTFTAVGFDQQNAEIALGVVDWKSSQGGSISRQALFQGSYSHRKVTVTASVGNIHKSADVTLLPILRKLQIFPHALQLKPNENQIFSAIGFDQYGEKIDPGEILWEASGGDIDQNGKFIADFNARGLFSVTASSALTYKFNKQTRILLVNVGISIRLLSYLLHVLAQVKDEYTSEQNPEDISEVSTTYTLIDNFEVSLQAWIHKSINKLIFRTLIFISKLSFKQAKAYVSASAEVIVLPVLRHLEISPAKVQLKPYEKINFKVIGLDQHYHEIQVSNVAWKATGGNISSNGTLSVDDKYKNITITATVGIISNSAHITVVNAPQITSRETFITQVDIKANPILEPNKDISTSKLCEKSNSEDVTNLSTTSNSTRKTYQLDDEYEDLHDKGENVNDEYEHLDDEYEDLDNEYEAQSRYKYQDDFSRSFMYNNLDDYCGRLEKSSWFYRSQLYYDGFTSYEFNGNYNDYLSYLDNINYLELLIKGF